MPTLPLSRRRLLIGSAAIAASLSSPALLRAATQAPKLALYGPPATPSIALALAVKTGALADLAAEVSLTIWRSPDELRAGLASGGIGLSVVPVQTAANLYNRGMGLRLVNAMTEGLLYIMAPEGAVGAMADLVGKRLALPFANDTPDFVLRALLDGQGLTEKVELVPAGTPIEAAQMLLAGRVDCALLAEPASSGVILMGGKAGLSFARAIDIQEEWGSVTGLGAVLPQAGLAVTGAFRENHSDLIVPLQAALAEATAAVLADPATGAQAASEFFELPAPILAAAIPHSRLVAKPASEVRPAIEAMLNLMAKGDSAIIGGKLPDDGFYAL
ncbi:MAG: ABC transporter substrate-binding protein [Paracoccus sp. (in: a-proteobacteria)]